MHTLDKPLPKLLEAARGDRPVDLLLRNARLINVFSGKVAPMDIAVADGFVVGFGPYVARTEVDLQGRFVAPGFIDAHVHIESAMVGPTQFARAVLPHGTTTVVADPHEIANVLGAKGIAYMLAASASQPLNFLFTLPSCVPATAMETAGARLGVEALKPFMDHRRVVALAEMMNFPGVIHADPEVLAKIEAMQAFGKPLDGHAPGLSGHALHAYLAAGIASDHECTTADEAREKLAAGMHIMIREGTGARNLDDLLPVIDAGNARRMMWCTDDRHAHDLTRQGGIDSMVRRAVRAGLDPVIAIRMATLNPAEYFGLGSVGAVGPGRRADLVIMNDLDDPEVHQVYCGGVLTAQEGRMVNAETGGTMTAPPSPMRVAVERLDFSVAAHGKRIRVIEALPDQIVTGATEAAALIRDGRVVADTGRDVLKIAVVERHRGTGRTGVGFISGFGLKRGALASTVAHDAHNIVVVGADDKSMLAAVGVLADMGGGLVVVDEERCLARLALPIAGLMSDQPIDHVCYGLEELLAAARRLGARLPDPFMTLSFMALPVIPALKITDHGLVDVTAFKRVPLFPE
ncbi:adenine deaminase [Desulfatitalea alkaliphila]|uniref:Adenine deaminase n=1 Tax=Desulfatitalea alkaliphila TaxID=2929485 RepID=A0AA41UNW7_9BACT|nr:adenine deaminase [Desulfatitalea alkaliphila]MCJ8499903.1 adenine deaminase [Desulfatitalea alkaliphila]